MSNLINGLEPDELCEGLIHDYLEERETRSVDIEDFITSYLGLSVKYESIAEDDQGTIGFISDGQTPVWIRQRGVPVQKVYPKSTIVIDQCLLHPTEYGRRRFTLAHEAGHYLLNRLSPIEVAAGFCQTYDSERKYTQGELKRKFSITEANADRFASGLLMPYFLVKQAVDVWNDGKPIVIHSNNMIPYDSRMKLKGMAYRLGVSQSALMIRLRKFGLIEYQKQVGYDRNDLKFGGVQNA